MRELDPIDQVMLVMRAAFGESYDPEGRVVHKVCVGEAGRDDDSIWIIGDWNTRRSNYKPDPPLTKDELFPVRLSRILQKIDGVNLDYYDQADSCAECQKYIETQPNCHGWQLYAVWSEEGYVCGECVEKDLDTWLEHWLDEGRGGHDRLTSVNRWVGEKELTDRGFVQWEPDDPHSYETGWHPGQTDDPEKLAGELRERLPDQDIVFFLDETGQFYFRWSVYTRPTPTEDDDA
jgi:hypothetical protein